MGVNYSFSGIFDMKKLILWAASIFVVPFLMAQNKCISYPSSGGVQQQIIKISVPEGAFSFKAAQEPGKSAYKVNHDIFDVSYKQSVAAPGIAYCSYIFKNDLAARDVGMNPSHLFGASNEGNQNMLQFTQDPGVQCDVNLEMLKGMMRANFGGLKVVNVELKSANANITADFPAPNPVAMRMLAAQSANGKIVIRNLENANTQSVAIENNMGDLRIIIGNGMPVQGEYNIISSTGKCELVIDKSQAVKIEIKRAGLATVNIPADYQKISDNTYISPAFKQNKSGKILKIVVKKDAGVLEVIGN